MPRNYRKEYDNYQGRPEQKKRRAQRNKVRRQALASGRAKLGDGMDIDHKDHNPMNNSKKNLRKITASSNRSFPRTKDARVKK